MPFLRLLRVYTWNTDKETAAREKCKADPLDEGVSLAPTSHGVAMQIYKFKFSKRFEHLSDVRFGQIEMQGAHVKPGTRVSRISNGEGTDLTAFRHDGTRQAEDSSCCG